MNRQIPFGLKMSTTHFFVLPLLLSLTAQPATAQLITEDKIRTYSLKLDGWNMESDQFKYHWVQLPAQIKNTQILNVQVLVFSDEAKPEVFNLTRQSGKTNEDKPGKSGGRSNFYFNNDGQLFIQLNRDPCRQDANGNCLTGVENRSGFFSVGNHGVPARSYRYRPQRTFYNATKTRVSVKIEYYCTNCPATPTNKFWLKIGPWNMSGGWKTFSESSFGIAPQNIVDLNATIHSDPNSASKIQVDNFEHLGARLGNPLQWRGRGGVLWLGYGLNTDRSTYKLNLYQGPVANTVANRIASSYRTTEMLIQPRNPDGSYPPVASVELKYLNSNTGRNRGWVLVEYTGSKSAIPSPYVFLTRALPIGAWNMLENTSVSLPLSQFGVSASRIGRIATVIQADPSACLPGCNPGIEVNNFHRTMNGSGGQDGHDDVGGITYIDESQGASGSVVISEFGGFASQGFYNTTNWYSTYTGSGNRGHVLIDYLAGSCAQGGSGFNLTAIPHSQTEKCAGTGNLVVEGAGAGLPAKSGSTDLGRDEFTYVHKYTSGANKTLTLKVQGLGSGAPSGTKAGIMIRSSLQQNAYHVSVVATPQGVRLVYRPETSPNTYALGNNTLQAPVWLRLFKQGNTITPYYSTDGINFNMIAPIGFAATNYYIGTLVSTSSPNMTQATFTNLSGF